jgi:hypothetical protein
MLEKRPEFEQQEAAQGSASVGGGVGLSKLQRRLPGDIFEH